MKKAFLSLLCLTLGAVLLTACGGEDQTFSEKSYNAESSDVQEIRVDVADRQIELTPSEDGQIHITYSESDQEYYDISVSDDKILTMTAEDNKKWTDYIGGKPSDEDRRIVLQVPDGILTALELSTTNEEISLTPLAVSGSVTLSSNGGDIRFEELDAGSSVTISAKNGDVSGSIVGGYDDYEISCEIKKGDSNLPSEKEGGAKRLNVSNNNGDIDIKFSGAQNAEN